MYICGNNTIKPALLHLLLYLFVIVVCFSLLQWQSTLWRCQLMGYVYSLSVN